MSARICGRCCIRGRLWATCRSPSTTRFSAACWPESPTASTGRAMWRLRRPSMAKHRRRREGTNDPHASACDIRRRALSRDHSGRVCDPTHPHAAVGQRDRQGQAFENSGYTWCVLFDLIPVREVTTDQLIAEVNPEKLPIESLEVTSQQDILGVLLNLLNGGIIDRGVIVSLNKVSVRGRFAHNRSKRARSWQHGLGDVSSVKCVQRPSNLRRFRVERTTPSSLPWLPSSPTLCPHWQVWV